MKRLMIFSLATSILTSCNSQPSMPAVTSSDKSSTAAKQPGFAVVELFTSQGCSSCPPADALLGREIATATKAGKKLIALSFHVDYWNRLGWTDPFSQHSFTQRQYGYSDKLNGDGVYTPQVIVNGQHELVGGNQSKLEEFVQQALADKPTATVSLGEVTVDNSTLKITYQYKGNAADLHIAIVQHSIATPVKAGENDGRTLTNYNVVKAWKTVTPQDGTNTATVETPAGYNTKDYSVVLYVQEKEYGKIIAADMN